MAYDALRTIMPIAGWPEERAREVEITVGADQVLPTRFRIGAAGVAPRGPSDSRAGQHTHGTHPPPFQIEEFGAAEFADYRPRSQVGTGGLRPVRVHSGRCVTRRTALLGHEFGRPRVRMPQGG